MLVEVIPKLIKNSIIVVYYIDYNLIAKQEKKDNCLEAVLFATAEQYGLLENILLKSFQRTESYEGTQGAQYFTFHINVVREVVEARHIAELMSVPNIVGKTKVTRLRWLGHVERIGEDRAAKKKYFTRPNERRPVTRLMYRWSYKV